MGFEDYVFNRLLARCAVGVARFHRRSRIFNLAPPVQSENLLGREIARGRAVE